MAKVKKEVKQEVKKEVKKEKKPTKTVIIRGRQEIEVIENDV